VRAALPAHNARMKELAEDYKRFLMMIDPPAAGEEDQSNLKAPVIYSRVMSKLGYNDASLFGEDAEVRAKPVEASDARKDASVTCMMNWILFDQMKLQAENQVSEFRRVCFGNSIVYRPWVRKTYVVRYSQEDVDLEKLKQQGKTFTVLPTGGVDVDEVEFEGVGFVPCWPDSIITPVEDVKSIQAFSWVLMKVPVTPQELLDGEADGRYAGISENWETIVEYARSGSERSQTGTGAGNDDVKKVGDYFEGVSYAKHGEESREVLELWSWYAKHRMPLEDGVEEFDLKNREKRESEIVVHYLPILQMDIGIQDLRESYPTMRNRRPFAEFRYQRTGRYWEPGLARILRSLEDEESDLYNKFIDCVDLQSGPSIFARPSAGLTEGNVATFALKPRHIHFVMDPTGINVVNMKTDLNPVLEGIHLSQAMQEKVDGQTDGTMGRASDRPNAPRTASGQAMLLEQGNMRLNFDMSMQKQDMRVFLGDVWDLWSSPLAPAEVFVRVTGDQWAGLIDVKGGGFKMTAEERGGRYDFAIKFATSVWSKEADKQNFVLAYDRLVVNPAIGMRADILGYLGQQLAKKMGFPDVAAMIPAPLIDDVPLRPEEEHNKIRQGERVVCHPADHDDLHLLEHYAALDQEKESKPDRQDPDFILRLARHILEHQGQAQQKKMMQAMQEGLAKALKPAVDAGALPLDQMVQEEQAQQQPGGGAGPKKPPQAASMGAGPGIQ
jgi:hypothetical protein